MSGWVSSSTGSLGASGPISRPAAERALYKHIAGSRVITEKESAFCVSIVSTVCARAGHLRSVAWNIGRRTSRIMFLWGRFGRTIVTDGTDRTDGIFRRSAYPNHSLSGSAFATERDFDTYCPKKCLRPAQVPGQGTGITQRPDAAVCSWAAFKADPQKIRQRYLSTSYARSWFPARTRQLGRRRAYSLSRPCDWPHRRGWKYR